MKARPQTGKKVDLERLASAVVGAEPASKRLRSDAEAVRDDAPPARRQPPLVAPAGSKRAQPEKKERAASGAPVPKRNRPALSSVEIVVDKESEILEKVDEALQIDDDHVDVDEDDGDGNGDEAPDSSVHEPSWEASTELCYMCRNDLMPSQSSVRCHKCHYQWHSRCYSEQVGESSDIAEGYDEFICKWCWVDDRYEEQGCCQCGGMHTDENPLIVCEYSDREKPWFKCLCMYHASCLGGNAPDEDEPWFCDDHAAVMAEEQARVEAERQAKLDAKAREKAKRDAEREAAKEAAKEEKKKQAAERKRERKALLANVSDERLRQCYLECKGPADKKERKSMERFLVRHEAFWKEMPSKGDIAAIPETIEHYSQLVGKAAFVWIVEYASENLPFVFTDTEDDGGRELDFSGLMPHEYRGLKKALMEKLKLARKENPEKARALQENNLDMSQMTMSDTEGSDLDVPLARVVSQEEKKLKQGTEKNGSDKTQSNRRPASKATRPGPVAKVHGNRKPKYQSKSNVDRSSKPSSSSSYSTTAVAGLNPELDIKRAVAPRSRPPPVAAVLPENTELTTSVVTDYRLRHAMEEVKPSSSDKKTASAAHAPLPALPEEVFSGNIPGTGGRMFAVKGHAIDPRARQLRHCKELNFLPLATRPSFADCAQVWLTYGGPLLKGPYDSLAYSLRRKVMQTQFGQWDCYLVNNDDEAFLLRDCPVPAEMTIFLRERRVPEVMGPPQAPPLQLGTQNAPAARPLGLKMGPPPPPSSSAMAPPAPPHPPRQQAPSASMDPRFRMPSSRSAASRSQARAGQGKEFLSGLVLLPALKHANQKLDWPQMYQDSLSSAGAAILVPQDTINRPTHIVIKKAEPDLLQALWAREDFRQLLLRLNLRVVTLKYLDDCFGQRKVIHHLRLKDHEVMPAHGFMVFIPETVSNFKLSRLATKMKGKAFWLLLIAQPAVVESMKAEQADLWDKLQRFTDTANPPPLGCASLRPLRDDEVSREDNTSKVPRGLRSLLKIRVNPFFAAVARHFFLLTHDPTQYEGENLQGLEVGTFDELIEDLAMMDMLLARAREGQH